MPLYQIHLDEGERQAILLALAELSIARPGWVPMLEQIALKMDATNAEGQAQMFEQFRSFHTMSTVEKLVGDAGQ